VGGGGGEGRGKSPSLGEESLSSIGGDKTERGAPLRNYLSQTQKGVPKQSLHANKRGELNGWREDLWTGRRKEDEKKSLFKTTLNRRSQRGRRRRNGNRRSHAVQETFRCFLGLYLKASPQSIQIKNPKSLNGPKTSALLDRPPPRGLRHYGLTLP